MKWRAGLSLAVIIGIVSCSPSEIAKTNATRSSLATTHELVSKYGTYPTDNFLIRIVASLKRSMKMSDAVSVSVLATNKPIAASTESGQILVSKGLLRALNSEAELAFILAHELSHIKLQHFENSQSAELESEADNLALISTYRAGYQIKASLNALNLPYTHNSIHQSVAERQKKLKDTLRSLPISIYGVVDTEEASEFRKSMQID